MEIVRGKLALIPSLPSFFFTEKASINQPTASNAVANRKYEKLVGAEGQNVQVQIVKRTKRTSSPPRVNLAVRSRL